MFFSFLKGVGHGLFARGWSLLSTFLFFSHVFINCVGRGEQVVSCVKKRVALLRVQMTKRPYITFGFSHLDRGYRLKFHPTRQFKRFPFLGA